MIANLKPAIIFLRETMMEGEKAKEILESWLKGWSFGHISSEGNSGGPITTWTQEYEEVQVVKQSTVLKQFSRKDPLGNLMLCIMFTDPIKNEKGYGNPSSLQDCWSQ